MISDSISKEQVLLFYRIRPLVILLSSAFFALAHEIPSDITAQVYVRPAGERMQMLVRVPLSSMRDIEFPETSEGYLDIEKLMPQLPDVATLWISQFVAIYEGEDRLPKPRISAIQISLPSDRSFTTFDDALRHVAGPRLRNDANVMWNQVMLDVLFEYRIRSDRSAFSIHSRLALLAARVATVLRFATPNGVRVYEFEGDPGRIPLDPSWYQSAWQFVKLGFTHILDGTDHLLFLFCLAIPSRQVRSLVLVVTAFTVAHSITLICSALNFAPGALWFPAVDRDADRSVHRVHGRREHRWQSGAVHRRWIIAFGFGLVHGFGFSFALRDTLQFAGSNLLTSLLAFNVGVEFGQVFAARADDPRSACNISLRPAGTRRDDRSLRIRRAHWLALVPRPRRATPEFRFEWPPLAALAKRYVVDPRLSCSSQLSSGLLLYSSPNETADK
jgi:hypothetical protein